MKSLKRVFALAVVLAMVLTSMPIVMAATTFDDVDAADQSTVDALVGLGIITGYDEDGTMLFKGDQTITRAEFATIICRLIGMGDAAASQRATDFTDVPSTHWASGYIKTAADTNGIINGYGDGTFGPEDNVKYEQAVKMIVCALGYQTKAEEEGTYPAGYLFVAKTMGLTTGVAGTVGQDATRMTVANLLNNSLTLPLMQKIVSGTKSAYYGIFDGAEYSPRKTVLSEYLNAVKLTGILQHNSISNDGLKENQVIVEITDNYQTRATITNDAYAEGNVIRLYVGDTNAKDFLGKRIDAFVTFEANKNYYPTILSVSESTNSDDKLALDLTDIIKMEAKDNYYAVKYWTDKVTGKDKTFYIDKATTFYVNGEQTFSAEELADEVNGDTSILADRFTTIEFTLVGNETGSYDYNYAFVEVFENLVVDSVDTIAGKVYAIDENPSDTFVDFIYTDDAEYELSLVDSKGAKVDPEDLVAYDVITAKINPFNWGGNRNNLRAIDAVLVQNKVEGTITEISSEDFYIGDTAYEADPGFLANGKSLSLDDAGTFYLDANNNIVAFDQTSSKNSNYAVIINKGIIGGADAGYQVKMYTSEGVMETRNFADKVKMPSYTTKEVVVTKTDAEVDAILAGKSFPIVVSYKLNTAGEIATLSLASDASYTDRTAGKSAALIKNAEAAEVEVKGENREIKSVKVGSTTFLMDDATKFIVLDSTVAGTPTASDFAIYSADDFTLDQSFEDVVVYDADDDRVASLIFSVSQNITLDSDNLGIAMTKTVTSLNNAAGDSTHKIVANNAQGEVTYVADPDATASYTQPKAGELFIPVSFTSDDEINKNVLVTEITYDDGEISDIALTQEFKNRVLNAKDSSDTTYYFGKVSRKKGNTIYFTNELDNKNGAFLAPDPDAAIIVGSTTQVMVYDQTKASKYRVSLESPSYMSFATKANTDGSYSPSDSEVASYYVFAREYNGVIVDVVYYVFADANLAFEPVKAVSLPAIIVEAIVNEDEVIAE